MMCVGVLPSNVEVKISLLAWLVNLDSFEGPLCTLLGQEPVEGNEEVPHCKGVPERCPHHDQGTLQGVLPVCESAEHSYVHSVMGDIAGCIDCSGQRQCLAC